jgi:hypothetical protein
VEGDVSGRYLSVIWPGDSAEHPSLKAAVARIEDDEAHVLAATKRDILAPEGSSFRAIVVDRKLGRIVREFN